MQATSKHFIVYADMTPAQMESYATKLERFDQAVRYVRRMQDPPLSDSRRLRVYVLPSISAVGKLVGSKMVAGMYVPWLSQSAIFVAKTDGPQWSDQIDSQNIFFHEYAHHLQLQDSSAPLPTWTTEGFAEFFATTVIRNDGSVEIGRFPEYRLYGLGGSMSLRLSDIVSGTYRNLSGSDVNALYAKGWLLTHYLTFSPTRKGQLATYVNAIGKGQAAADAAKLAFGDLRKLTDEVDRYARGSLPGVTIDGKVLNVGEISVRPLRPGEAAAMDAHIQSRRGVDKKSAPIVMSLARKTISPFPEDPFAQTALAEAEFDAQNYAEAEAAADRALKADPKSVKALIYKGLARLELAKKDAKSAKWDEVRSWFIKANRLEPENAEPLTYYYRSFLDAGQRPTPNAVEGLLDAIYLAPQRDELRSMAVRQLLSEGRVAEARPLFASLAFKPHAGAEWRSWADAVLAAMDSGGAVKALAAMDAPIGDGKAQDPKKTDKKSN